MNILDLGPITNFGQKGSLGTRLLELGYIFTLGNPQSLTEKRELRYILSQHGDCTRFFDPKNF